MHATGPLPSQHFWIYRTLDSGTGLFGDNTSLSPTCQTAAALPSARGSGGQHVSCCGRSWEKCSSGCRWGLPWAGGPNPTCQVLAVLRHPQYAVPLCLRRVRGFKAPHILCLGTGQEGDSITTWGEFVSCQDLCVWRWIAMAPTQLQPALSDCIQLPAK